MKCGLCVACLLLAIGGCNVFASKQEYRDYRNVRLTHDDTARLLAMQRYVARYPQGHWRDEVQREREARELAVFEAGKSDRAGIALYLSAFPDGKFTAQAKSRLRAVALIEQRKREEAERALQLEAQRMAHETELSRTWVTRFFSYWVKTLLSIRNWGAPIEQVARGHAEFSRAFGRPPRPRCTADECVKYYESSFAVPVPGGTRVERAMRLALRLRMESGQFVRAELLLPAWGFSRWYELEERRVVMDGDSEVRGQAVAWAMANVLPLLDAFAEQRAPLEGYVMAEVRAPAIGPSGELVDTTAEDPSAPPNRIEGRATPDATVAELVRPAPIEAAPDMELSPLQVGADGRKLGGGGEKALDPVVPRASAAQSDMVLDTLAVPAPGQAALPTPTAVASAPQVPPSSGSSTASAVTRAFLWQGLRIVVFAAGRDARAPAYDGIVIERVASERTRGNKHRAEPAIRSAPRRPTPVAQPPVAPR